MKISLTIILSLFLVSAVTSQESVIWGAEVLDVSSEYGPLEYSALQVLHKPNVLPRGGENPNAWRPKKSDNAQYVSVLFANPIKAKQVAIAESENPGAITKVTAYDSDFNEYVLFELTPRAIPIETRLLNLFFEETEYNIRGIRVELDGATVPGYNSIDAIGISASNIPINVLIELAKGVSNEDKSDRLGENVNSSYVEHSPIISPDGKRLYFSRKYHPENVGGVDDPEDIWVSEWDEEKGDWKPAVNVGPPLNTQGPNFISSISSEGDGKDMFVLGNRYGKKGRMYTGISMAYLENGEFTKPESIEVENEYNYSPKADFFLAPGGQALIQSVERDDSYGGRDLYISFKRGNTWSEPKNLGGDINTAADEAAPFMAEDLKTLYFSSSGYSGYGGMDIYVSRKLDETWEKWSIPDNLGTGINSDSDDQYFSIPSSGTNLYFTRGNVDDDTDIYSFKVDEFFIDPEAEIASSVTHLLEEAAEPPVQVATPEEPETPSEPAVITVTGLVLDAKTSQPIENVKVVVERLPDGVDIGEVTSGAGGQYTLQLRPGARFGLSAVLDGFIAQDENLDLNDKTESETININLKLAPIEVGQPIVLNNIFFDFNKWELRTASYPELDRVLEYLTSGRIRKIEISGHTDSKGTEEVNLKFSRNRANSVWKYFQSNGIEQSRVEVVGYGESRPVDTNDTVEGRQNNRRVEFKVLETN